MRASISISVSPQASTTITPTVEKKPFLVLQAGAGCRCCRDCNAAMRSNVVFKYRTRKYGYFVQQQAGTACASKV